MIEEVTWVWLLLGVFLVIGLVVHERTGSRLGGVLVLPLLLVYALIDLAVLVVFALGTVLSLSVGHFFYAKRLYYGRRLLYIFLIAGLTGSFLLIPLVEPQVGTIVMALLPGLFAYNLHREGRYLEGVSTFMIWFGVMLSGVTVLVWLITDPEAVSKLGGWAGDGMGGVEAALASFSPSLATGFSSLADTIAQGGSGLAAAASQRWDQWLAPHLDSLGAKAQGFLASAAGLAVVAGTTFISVAAAHGADGGAAE